jgi:hypothetical protein
VPICYHGGVRLDLDGRYLLIDDHLLEHKILECFPPLRAISKGRAGRLMQHIVQTVLVDQPDFLPMEIEEAFRALLDAPAHVEEAELPS